ncbi:Uncharacterised protein [Mycobacteroides abscessus subsp. abscessus]|nr:Uncharacterised protein [Mycobacteroides abscessus subsp. abscessus]
MGVPGAPSRATRSASATGSGAPSGSSPRNARKTSSTHSRAPIPSITPWNTRNTTVTGSAVSSRTSQVRSAVGSIGLPRTGSASSSG